MLPKINPQNVHHVFAYECDASYNGNPKIVSGSCNQVSFQKHCQHFGYVWSYGGATVIY